MKGRPERKSFIKAAHAGFAPEEGINALSIAAEAVAAIKTGRISPTATLNFGTMRGGTGNNIVPELIKITGEIRSLKQGEAEELLNEVFMTFSRKASESGATTVCSSTKHIRSYSIHEAEAVLTRFKRAARAAGIEEAETVSTFGGSDANRFNEYGIKTIVLSCGMENVHSTEEFTSKRELIKSARLVLKLMTVKEE